MADVDRAQVKLILTQLFRNDLGFIKSTNLAGEMLSRVWSHSEGDNNVQRAICVLIYAATRLGISTIPPHFSDESEAAIYLWCHQKVVRKKRWWFFTVSDTGADRKAASEWLVMKAAKLAAMSGEIDYFRTFEGFGDKMIAKLGASR